MRSRLAILILGLFVTTAAGATPVFRVFDTEPTRLSGKVSPIGPFAALGGLLLFPGGDPANKTGLWRSDGTETGTLLVKDLSPSGYSNLYDFVEFKSTLYFFAQVDSQPALWRTDGATEGTTVVHLFEPGSDPEGLVATGATLFFAASDAAHGRELWKSDGTPGGTVMVSDLKPGSEGSNPDLLTTLGDRVFFRTDTPEDGLRLWVSDGTAAGTEFVHAQGLSVNSIVARAGNLVYFTDIGSATDAELWRTDGSPSGTVELAVFLAESLFYPPLDDLFGPTGLVDLDGVAIFRAKDMDHGWQPWRSDGTPAGTKRIADVIPVDGTASIRDFIASGDLVYFTAYDPAAGGEGLWKTDGTAAGTALVREFPGPAGSASNLWAANGLLFFQADDLLHGSEPWRSDGTEEGTFSLGDLRPGTFGSSAGPFVSIGAEILFGASSLLWRTDGTVAGTALVDDATHGQSGSPVGLTDVAGRIFFATTDIELSSRDPFLWSSDGTADGTRREGSFCSVAASTITAFRGDAYYFADDCVSDFQLFNSHGPLKYIPHDFGDVGTKPVPIGDEALFFTIGRQLWRTDGSASGTTLVSDFGPLDFPELLTPLGGSLFFFVYSSDNHFQVWRTDGTPAGTEMSRDLGVQELLSPVVPLGDGEVFFVLIESGGAGLWKSDGTYGGTLRVTGLNDYSSALTAAGPFLYFSSNAGEIWRTDGTELGTLSLGAIRAWFLTAAGGVLFFVGDDGEHGPELWSSTGFPQTTRMVRDIYPGAVGSWPTSLTDAGGILVFAASDGAHGIEMWRSDGTERGTKMVGEVAPGPSSSSPSGFARSGPFVFFSADDGDTGFELWAVPASELGAFGPRPGIPRTLPRRQ